jgi:alanine dehydrogenase
MVKTPKTLILGKADVRKLITIREAIRAVEFAFKELGRDRVRMPPKIYLDLEKYSGDFRAMPAYLEKLGRCSLKWVNAHPGNAGRGLPAVMAVIILSDPKTGFPLCLMDGTVATNLRTGAAGAVAAKYLANPDSRTLGLVGCGAQAYTQLEALREFFDFEEVRVWGHEPAILRKFMRDTARWKLRMIPAASVQECVTQSDMVVTTTPSRKPIVRLAWLKKGVHINAIGADAAGKQELEPAILKKAKVVVDSWPQASHGGEINVAVSRGLLTRKDVYAELGEVVSRQKKGRLRPDEMTVFDSTGLAIQDTAVADVIYSNALKAGKGHWLSIVC